MTLTRVIAAIMRINPLTENNMLMNDIKQSKEKPLKKENTAEQDKSV
jgi:hypothetical protein